MPPIDRRHLLRGLAAVTALPLVPGCGGSGGPGENATPPGPAPSARGDFLHGVASGDPLPDRVVLWTRVTPETGIGPLRVRYQVATDPQMRQVRLDETVTTDAGRDFTVKVDAQGLEPGTTYYYRFETATARSPVGRTRTLPRGDVQRARLALVACSNFSAGWFNAYRVLARRDVEAILHVGDWFYEGAGENSPIGRPHDPPWETVTLADYRRRHAQTRRDPDLAEAMRQHPFITVWDDHESANNSWRDGAQQHQPESEGDWQLRKQASAQAYAEWMPIRLPDPGDPLTIWRHFAFGNLLDLFMLDTRLQRNAPEIANVFDATSDDPSRSMLGEAQAGWLREQMLASAQRGSAWRLLGQQTMMAPHRTFTQGEIPLPFLPEAVASAMGLRQGGGSEGTDNWSAYAAERNSLLRYLREEGIANNVVLSGDIHTGWAADVVEDPFTPFNPLTPALTGAPGYDPLTGRGSAAVELVAMSVSSGNAIDSIASAGPGAAAAVAAYNNLVVESLNPNVRYHNAAIHGFVLVDITPEQVLGEFWQTGPNQQRLETEEDAVFDAAAAARRGEPGAPGTNHLQRAAGPSPERPGRPALAPADMGGESVAS